MKIISNLSVAFVWLLLLASAVSAVWSKHQSRSLFVELQRLQRERDGLDTEWGQLKLEQSTWSTYGRVEQLAHDDLKMTIPRPDEVRIVQP
jgi:cell division protein FtsL